jgi:hypothetical protein
MMSVLIFISWRYSHVGWMTACSNTFEARRCFLSLFPGHAFSDSDLLSRFVSKQHIK